MISVFLEFFWMCPSPPSYEVRHKKEDLQKHIRVQLHLIKQKEEHHDIDDPDWPAPHNCFCGQPDSDPASKRPEKLEVAHRIAENFKEYIIDVEKAHSL